VALYLEHFGLNEPPFRITPHPEFFFDGADRGATLEGLLYAILHDEGIVKVSGEIGSGKTTLCRVLMERLPPEVETVFLANPSYSRTEILLAIADELGLAQSSDPAASALRDLQARLIDLHGRGRRVVVMIDEAHAMPDDTLEQVRLLSNLETSRHKLLQIVLFGQPELDEALAKTSMRQLKDRITHSFRTRPLASPEVAKYIAFRMRAAGYRGPDVFSATAVLAIARASSGLTRRINVLCDKSLLAAFAANTHGVTPREVRAAVADSDFAPVVGTPARGRRAFAAAALIILGTAMGAAAIFWLDSEPNVPVAPAIPAPKAARVAPAAPVAPAVQGALVAPAEQAVPPASAAVPAPAGSPPQSPAAAPPAQPAAPLTTGPKTAPPTSVPLVAPAQLKRFNGYSAGRNPLLRERLVATREALLTVPDDSYSIELFIAENSDPERTERFLIRARDLVSLTELYIFPVLTGSRYVLRVTYGTYASQEEAADAAKRLPPKYQNAFRFIVRRLGDLRAII
jgi:MSHA biogenesis protein MshM